MSNATEQRTQWHVLTVRFGTSGTLDRSKAPTDPRQIGESAAAAVRAVLRSDQELFVDEAQLFVDQGPDA